MARLRTGAESEGFDPVSYALGRRSGGGGGGGQGATHWIGVTTTELTDGATTNPITVNGASVTAVAGDITQYGDMEFIWSGSAWQAFGGASDYDDLSNRPQINGVTLSGNKSTADLTTVSWNSTVSVGFAAQATTAEINGTSFTKVSDTAFTPEQLDGAALSMQGTTITLSSSDLTDLSAAGVTGTLVNVPTYGPVIVSCTEAGSVVSEPGFYFRTDGVYLAPYITMSYTAALTAFARAIGAGDIQMEDGVTDLPNGVVWLQLE